MDPRALKDALYEQFALLGKALASAKRLELLDLLSQSEKTVEALAGHADLSIANTSAHLKVLRTARLVTSRKAGQHVYYRLGNEAIGTFWVAFRSLGEQRLPDVQALRHAHFADPQGPVPMDRRTLQASARRGQILIIDVRPEDEYRAGHLPGAVSLPLIRLKQELDTLPRDRPIVAYCRGPYCVMAMEAVQLLRRHGFQAIRWQDGVADWRAAGLPVEVEGGGAR